METGVAESTRFQHGSVAARRVARVLVTVPHPRVRTVRRHRVPAARRRRSLVGHPPTGGAGHLPSAPAAVPHRTRAVHRRVNSRRHRLRHR